MLTLRNTKGSALSFTEMDDNLTYLESLAGGGGGDTIYTADGTLATDRTVEVDDKSINFKKNNLAVGGIQELEFVSGGTPGSVSPPINGLTQKSTSGAGTGAVFTVNKSGGYFVFASTPGTGYEVGDTITISGADIGGVDGTDDLIITVTKIDVDTEDNIKLTQDKVGLYKDYSFEESLKGVTSVTKIGQKPGDYIVDYEGVPQKTTSGTGTGAVFTIVFYTKGIDKIILVAGSGYEVGDTITVSGADIGGTDGVDDLTFTVLSVEADVVSGDVVELNSEGVLLNTSTEVNINAVDDTDPFSSSFKMTTYSLDLKSQVNFPNAPSVGLSTQLIDQGLPYFNLFYKGQFNNSSSVNCNSDSLNLSGGNVEVVLSNSVLNSKMNRKDDKYQNIIQNVRSLVGTTSNDVENILGSINFDNTENITIMELIVTIFGVNTDGSKGYTSKITSSYRHIPNTSTTLIGTQQTVTNSDFATASSSVSVLGDIYIYVTGEATENIEWYCKVESNLSYKEVASGTPGGGGGGK